MDHVLILHSFKLKSPIIGSLCILQALRNAALSAGLFRISSSRRVSKHDYHFQIDSGGFWKWVGWWNVIIFHKVAGSRSGGVWPVPAKVKYLHWIFSSSFYWKMKTGENLLLTTDNFNSSRWKPSSGSEQSGTRNAIQGDQDLVTWTTTD